MGFYTDNGPDYTYHKCGMNTIGQIGHICPQDDDWDGGDEDD